MPIKGPKRRKKMASPPRILSNQRVLFPSEKTVCLYLARCVKDSLLNLLTRITLSKMRRKNQQKEQSQDNVEEKTSPVAYPEKRKKKFPKRKKKEKILAKEFIRNFKYFSRLGGPGAFGNVICYRNTLWWMKKAGICDNHRVTIRDIEVHFINNITNGYELKILEFIRFLKSLSEDRGLKMSTMLNKLLNSREIKPETKKTSFTGTSLKISIPRSNRLKGPCSKDCNRKNYEINKASNPDNIFKREKASFKKSSFISIENYDNYRCRGSFENCMHEKESIKINNSMYSYIKDSTTDLDLATDCIVPSLRINSFKNKDTLRKDMKEPLGDNFIENMKKNVGAKLLKPKKILKNLSKDSQCKSCMSIYSHKIASGTSWRHVHAKDLAIAGKALDSASEEDYEYVDSADESCKPSAKLNQPTETKGECKTKKENSILKICNSAKFTTSNTDANNLKHNFKAGKNSSSMESALKMSIKNFYIVGEEENYEYIDPAEESCKPAVKINQHSKIQKEFETKKGSSHHKIESHEKLTTYNKNENHLQQNSNAGENVSLIENVASFISVERIDPRSKEISSSSSDEENQNNLEKLKKCKNRNTTKRPYLNCTNKNQTNAKPKCSAEKVICSESMLKIDSKTGSSESKNKKISSSNIEEKEILDHTNVTYNSGDEEKNTSVPQMNIPLIKNLSDYCRKKSFWAETLENVLLFESSLSQKERNIHSKHKEKSSSCKINSNERSVNISFSSHKSNLSIPKHRKFTLPENSNSENVDIHVSHNKGKHKCKASERNISNIANINETEMKRKKPDNTKVEEIQEERKKSSNAKVEDPRAIQSGCTKNKNGILLKRKNNSFSVEIFSNAKMAAQDSKTVRLRYRKNLPRGKNKKAIHKIKFSTTQIDDNCVIEYSEESDDLVQKDKTLSRFKTQEQIVQTNEWNTKKEALISRKKTRGKHMLSKNQSLRVTNSVNNTCKEEINSSVNEEEKEKNISNSADINDILAEEPATNKVKNKNIKNRTFTNLPVRQVKKAFLISKKMKNKSNMSNTCNLASSANNKPKLVKRKIEKPVRRGNKYVTKKETNAVDVTNDQNSLSNDIKNSEALSSNNSLNAIESTISDPNKCIKKRVKTYRIRKGVRLEKKDIKDPKTEIENSRALSSNISLNTYIECNELSR